MNEVATAAAGAGGSECADEAVQNIAQRLLWWQPPAVSLKQPRRFIAQVMTLGTWNDVRTTWRVFGEEAFREALRQAPPGVFDLHSSSFRLGGGG